MFFKVFISGFIVDIRIAVQTSVFTSMIHANINTCHAAAF